MTQSDGQQEWVDDLNEDETTLFNRFDRILSAFEDTEGEVPSNPLADLPYDLIPVKKRVLVFKAMCE